MISRTRTLPSGRVVQVRISERTDGDFAADAAGVDRRRAEVHPGPWAHLHQVHGRDVHRVRRPGSVQGRAGDALVTAVAQAPLAVQTADCAPVVLLGRRSVGLVHAGWRGLCAGVLQAALGAIEADGDRVEHALLGPCVAARSYPFGADDLAVVASAVGPAVVATTDDGRPALDLRAGVTSVLGDGVAVQDLGFDTTDERWFSHRQRGDGQRQMTAVWIEA